MSQRVNIFSDPEIMQCLNQDVDSIHVVNLCDQYNKQILENEVAD